MHLIYPNYSNTFLPHRCVSADHMCITSRSHFRAQHSHRLTGSSGGSDLYSAVGDRVVVIVGKLSASSSGPSVFEVAIVRTLHTRSKTSISHEHQFVNRLFVGSAYLIRSRVIAKHT